MDPPSRAAKRSPWDACGLSSKCPLSGPYLGTEGTILTADDSGDSSASDFVRMSSFAATLGRHHELPPTGTWGGPPTADEVGSLFVSTGGRGDRQTGGSWHLSVRQQMAPNHPPGDGAAGSGDQTI